MQFNASPTTIPTQRADLPATPSVAVPSVAAMLETVVGCKWSLRMLGLIREGTNRPGAIGRSLEGLTTKVQNDCFRKLVRFDILKRTAYPEVPPRVEYHLTPFGLKFVALLDAISELQRERNAR